MSVVDPATPKSSPHSRVGMEPMVGIEPTTYGLRNRCSTTELHWHPGPGQPRRPQLSGPFHCDAESTGSPAVMQADESPKRTEFLGKQTCQRTLADRDEDAQSGNLNWLQRASSCPVTTHECEASRERASWLDPTGVRREAPIPSRFAAHTRDCRAPKAYPKDVGFSTCLSQAPLPTLRCKCSIVCEARSARPH